MRILCFDIRYVGFSSKEANKWKLYAKRGDRVGAVKNLRQYWNEGKSDDDPARLSLKVALLKVTNYMKRRKITAFN